MDAATNGRRDSPPSNIVKHRGEFCRRLLVSPSSLHGVELLEGWSLQQNEQRDCWPCQLDHCILNETVDGQSILSLISLLDRIRSGWFDLISLLHATAPWSRARHFGNGPQPLRSRTEPFGLQSLDPNSISKFYSFKPDKEGGGHSGFSRGPRWMAGVWSILNLGTA